MLAHWTTNTILLGAQQEVITMVVSIVVITQNQSSALEICLHALDVRQFPSREIATEVIVVDDCSGDDTPALLEHLSRKMSFVAVRMDVPRGAAAARNEGLRRARGDLVLFTDGDQLPEPSWVAAHVRRHEREDALVVIGHCDPLLAVLPAPRDEPDMRRELDKLGPRLQEFASRAMQRGKRHLVTVKDVRENFARVREFANPRPYRGWESVFSRYSDDLVGYAVPWLLTDSGNLSVRRQRATAVGGFDENFRESGLEDVEFGYRLCNTGCRLVYAREALSYHQVHPRDPIRWFTQLARNAQYFMEKHQCDVAVLLLWRNLVQRLDRLQYGQLVSCYQNLLQGDAAQQALAHEFARLVRRECEIYGSDLAALLRLRFGT